jgi:hypothetical protein
MNLFFLEWSDKDLGSTDMIKEFQKRGHKIGYISGTDLDINYNKSEFPGTIFHDYHDARAGIPSPQVDTSDFEPPSESLLNELLCIESNILVLMNKRFEWMGENQKKHLYYTYVQYWNGVLKKYKPDAIIMPSAPHTIYDLPVYGLAKKYGIKMVIFELSAIYDRAVVMSDFVTGFDRLQKQLEEDRGKNFTVDDFDKDIRRYYDNQISDDKNKATPKVIKSLSKIYSKKNIVKAKSTAIFRSFRDKVFFERVGKRIMRIGKGNPQQEYESLQKEPDYSNKYVYFPLHYQPECSTCPLGGVFVDQILAVKILAYSLPKNWKVYVKEQSFQWKPRGATYFKYRFEGYYKLLAEVPNVELVPTKINTFELIENSQAVSSITGTAPWEGLFRGKLGMFFGYAWYRDCPGLFRIKDVESCKEFLQKVQEGYKPKIQDVINYLVSFQKVSPRTIRSEIIKTQTDISIEQSVKNHVDAISKELGI